MSLSDVTLAIPDVLPVVGECPQGTPQGDVRGGRDRHQQAAHGLPQAGHQVSTGTRGPSCSFILASSASRFSHVKYARQAVPEMSGYSHT